MTKATLTITTPAGTSVEHALPVNEYGYVEVEDMAKTIRKEWTDQIADGDTFRVNIDHDAE